MNKKDFVDLMKAELASKKRSYSVAEVEDMVQAFMDSLAKAVTTGDRKLQLTGYFSAQPHYVPATTRRNPKTGDAIQKEATHTLKIKPGNILKMAVAGLKPEKHSK